MWEGRAITVVPTYPTFATIEPLDKGWSSDRKFIIETFDGERLLLRLADIAEFERKQIEYTML